MFKSLPQELDEKILLNLDSDYIHYLRNTNKNYVSDYVWFRKKHKTIQDAAKNGNLIGLKYLLEQNTNTTIYEVEYPFRHIVHVNEEKITDINAYNIIMAFNISAGYGHLNIVRYLLENNNDIIQSDEYSIMSLLYSSYNGHLDIVKYLVEQGLPANIDRSDALRLSFLNGHLEVVKYLIENGADINVISNNLLQHCIK